MPDLSALSEQLQAVLGSLPHRPGIYLHKDADGHVLYVGKAADLHQRVRQYFVDPADLSPKNRALVAKIADIEFIVVDSEVEALILENEYIKRHQPRYNVLLRDDKNYPYIKVSLAEDFPRVYRVRSFKQDGNRYFGPYTSSAAVDATLDLMDKLFPYRTCRYDASSWAPPRGQEDNLPSGWKQKLLPRPCTQYFIHRCNAPCVSNVSREEYDAVIRQAVLFLEGKHDAVLADLKEHMRQAAENLEFERAAALRDRVKAVEQVLEKQKIINTTGQADQDVIALAATDDETCAQVFFFRGGKLAGREYFILRGTAETPPGEVMAAFIAQFYAQAPSMPSELIVQHELQDAEALRQWLRQKHGGAVTITVPQRGDKVRLVAMVAQNASEVLEQQRIKWLSDSQKTALALDELRDALRLPDAPQRIECYDISNIQGTSAVGSMIVFEGGRPKTSDYRRFRIKTIVGQDDVGSLQEVLRRRFKRAAVRPAALARDALAAAEVLEEMGGEPDLASRPEAGEDAVRPSAGEADGAGESWVRMPDLVMIDGGRPQLNAALAALDELGMAVPVVGIAKEDHGSISTHEEIYLPLQPQPVVLPRGSQALYLLQRVRDEAHRFALTYHRQVRSTKTFKSVLDEIPGVGPKRKKALIRRFGSARAIAAAPLEELTAVEGINRELAERIKEHVGSGRAEAVDPD
jgi:excinuclease ABC subunit C